jgi:uncharacterized protein YjiS (DUF1127 family)
MAYCVETLPVKPAKPLFSRILDFFRSQKLRRRADRELSNLDDRQLHDIGVSRRDVAVIVDREIGKLHLDGLLSRDSRSW